MKSASKIFVFLLLALVSTASSQPKKKAADFSLKAADGKTVTLSSMKGKVVLINFWATWCGPCRAEIPGFLELYEKYKGRGFEIVGISLDEEGWRVINPFVQRLNITYPILMGSGDLAHSYGSLEFIPKTVLVDKDGTIVKEHVGYMSKEELEKQLRSLF